MMHYSGEANMGTVNGGARMGEDRKTLDAAVRPAILGSSITGDAGRIAALPALFAGEFLAASVSVAGVVLSFGLLANALIRE
jgi:hypothetical protein